MTDETIIELVVTEDLAGSRLDRALAVLCSREREISRAQAADWLAAGRVRINRQHCTKSAHRVKTGDVVEVALPPPRELALKPEADIPFGILFEDEDIIVVDKPPGLVVHPGAGRQNRTLVNALLAHLGPKLQQIGDALRPGIVHRLDQDTSGVMIVAKSDAAFRELRRQLKPPRLMKRTYLCLVEDLPRKMTGSVLEADKRSGTIELPIGRHPRVRVKMAVVSENGKPARTYWELRESFAFGALLEVRLDTGRTHQIRVHLSHCGAPLFGDPVYGRASLRLPPPLRNAVRRFGRQALHSARLGFVHPISGEAVSFESPLPEDFRTLLNAFREA